MAGGDGGDGVAGDVCGGGAGRAVWGPAGAEAGAGRDRGVVLGECVGERVDGVVGRVRGIQVAGRVGRGGVVSQKLYAVMTFLALSEIKT